MFIKAARIVSADREREDRFQTGEVVPTAKQLNMTIELDLSSDGSFPLDAGDPRGTKAAQEELLVFLLSKLQEFDTSRA